MALLPGKNINVSGLLSGLKKRIGLLFLAALLVLLVLEIAELKTSVGLAFQSQASQPEPIQKIQKVQINFDAYNQVIDRIYKAQTFQPSSEAVVNPFKSVQ